MSMIESTDINELKILQKIDSEDRWWKSEEIAEDLQLSKATVQKYLSALKMRIEAFPEEKVSLQISTSRGIYFSRSADFNLQFIYTDILKELLIFSILDAFIYNEAMPITQVSADNYVSVASIRRKYKTLNNYFDGLDILIKKDTLVGDERQIRWFFSELYWQVFRGVEWPFALIPRDYVENMVETIQNFFGFEIIPEVKEQMMYWIAVNALRHSKGYRVPEDIEIKKFALNHPLFEKFNTILKQIFPSKAKVHDKNIQGELQYLFLLVCALPVLEKNEEFSELVYQSHKNAQTAIYRATQLWLRLYEENFEQISSSHQYHRIEKKLVRIHSFSYLYKMGAAIYPIDNYVNEIFDDHPVFSKKMEQLFTTLQANYPEVVKSKDYLMENYALLSMDELNIDKFEQSITIALSFSEGLIYERVVRERILTHFAGKYKLEFVPYNQVKDLLITDLPQQNTKERHSVISVRARLTERDYHNIEEEISKTL